MTVLIKVNGEGALCQESRKIGNWGGPYSFTRIHKPWEQSISKEINKAQSEYMKIWAPSITDLLRSLYQPREIARSLNLNKKREHICVKKYVLNVFKINEMEIKPRYNQTWYK